jgi:hypothetical protein
MQTESARVAVRDARARKVASAGKLRWMTFFDKLLKSINFSKSVAP